MSSPSRPTSPTAHDVARLAGVSQSAVSRAFTPGASVSRSMRAKIAAAAQEVGYRPNILARSLSMGRSNFVGVISGQMQHPFFAIGIEQLARKLSFSKQRILLFPGKADASVDELIDEMLSFKVNAVILMGVDVSSTLALDCEKAGIPVILFNPIEAPIGDAIEIYADNDAGAQAIANLFIETRRKNIVFMAGPSNSSANMARENAFMDYFTERGLPRPRRILGGYTQEGAIAATRELFRYKRDRPDAIFCSSDLTALPTLETLRTEFGIEPGPESECSLAGFENIAMSGWPSFSLTTYSQPIDEIIDEAIRYINAVDRSKFARRVIVKGELIIRKTA